MNRYNMNSNVQPIINNDIIRLFNSEYVVFLTNKFYGFFKRKLLKYFDKYNILYLNYDKKTDVMKELNIINNIILSDNNIIKQNIIKKIQNNKLKCLYFLENKCEPNIMYKKISFSKEELFLSFDNYTIKKMEYKFRTFCQIAEKLGAKEINIVSKLNNSSKSEIELKVFDENNGIKLTDSNMTNYNIDLHFKYTNYPHNLLLNKFYIHELIKRENVFFITKEDFDADVDLKFLIDTRCINLIESYDTDIIINTINEVERKVLFKALEYGLSLGYSNITSNTTQVNIKINFIDIYESPQNISGHQLYPQDNGFWHLSNIIQLELNNNKYKYDNYNNKRIYGKINDFFKSHIYSVKYGYINIPDKSFPENPENSFNQKKQGFFNHPEYNIIIMYDDIIKNFNQDEINELFYEFFNNNMSYTVFKQLRDLVIFDDEKLKYMITKDTPNIINKFYFTILQYKNIQNTNNIVYDKIHNYLKEITKNTINSKLNKDIFDVISECDLHSNNLQSNKQDKSQCDSQNNIYTKFINKLEDNIINSILSVIKNNYLNKYGIENINEDEIINTMFNDTNIYFENNIINLLKEIFCEIDCIITTPNSRKNLSNDILDKETKFNYIILNKNYIEKSIFFDIMTPRQTKKHIDIKPECAYRHKILEIISEILNVILLNICKKIYNNNFLQHPLFVKKNICEMIIKYNKSYNIDYNNVMDKINTTIPSMLCYTNYYQYKIFYTWENIHEIIKNIKNI